MRVLKDKGATIIAHSGVREYLEKDDGKYKRFITEKYGWDQEKGDEILGDVLLSLPDQLIEKDTVLGTNGEGINLFVTPGLYRVSSRYTTQPHGLSSPAIPSMRGLRRQRDSGERPNGEFGSSNLSASINWKLRRFARDMVTFVPRRR